MRAIVFLNLFLFYIVIVMRAIVKDILVVFNVVRISYSITLRKDSVSQELSLQLTN